MSGSSRPPTPRSGRCATIRSATSPGKTRRRWPGSSPSSAASSAPSGRILAVTTGAGPGFLALAVAKLAGGSRTIWIDSIANTERMSLSGRLARPVADVRLVQWQHLARPGGPEFWGAVL